MASIRVEQNGRVTTVILQQPEKRNAVDGKTAAELVAAFTSFDEDDNAHCAVFWGEGGAFCAGADLKAFASGSANELSADGAAPMGPSRLTLRKPVIAAIAGPAVAGGLELALWCDLRVAEEDAILGVYCRRWGVPLIDGGTVRLPRLIGLSHALDLILTGRGVSAGEALAMGLVNRVVPQGQSRPAAEALAAAISAFPQECLRNDRQSAYEQEDLSCTAAMKNEFNLGMASLSAGAMEGAQRFARGEGRHGDFGG